MHKNISIGQLKKKEKRKGKEAGLHNTLKQSSMTPKVGIWTNTIHGVFLGASGDAKKKKKNLFCIFKY